MQSHLEVFRFLGSVVPVLAVALKRLACVVLFVALKRLALCFPLSALCSLLVRSTVGNTHDLYA
jgi:hypothetical protein